MKLVERRGKYDLCCYPRAGWAVFEYKPDKDSEYKLIKNGKAEDVLPVYKRML